MPGIIRSISGVPTSIAAFVGRTRRGPCDCPVTIKSWSAYEQHFGGLWEKSPLSVAVRDFFDNGGNQAVVVRVFSAPAPAAHDAATMTARLVIGTLKLKASSPGVWGNALRVRIDLANASGLFALMVRDHAGDIIEHFSDLSLDPAHPRRVDQILEAQSALVRIDGPLPDRKPAQASAQPAAGKQWWEDPASYVAATEDARGSDGDLPTDEVILGSPVAKTGLYALDNAPDVNLLCIPPRDFDGEDIGSDLVDAAIDYCLGRRAILLIDPPSGWKTGDAARTGIDADPPVIGRPSPNAAIYFPRIVRPSPFAADAGAVGAYTPCGAVAGVIAGTDASRGVWKSPAGMEATLSNAPQLEVTLTETESSVLNAKGVNCLRAFPAIGPVVWGARTRMGADSATSEWKYLPVRRTALFIEESLYRGTQWAAFEPNDGVLWAAIRLSVGSFMHDLFLQGAFRGTAPRDAYFVRCDQNTTTQADIDRGLVNIVVGFAPLRQSEFLVIQLQQAAGEIAA